MKKFLIASILLLTSAFFGFSQSDDLSDKKSETHVLTVEDAVSLALENNISIKQSKMDLDLLETKNKYSWNSVSPSISVSGGVSGSQSGKLENFSDSQSNLSWSASGSLSLSLSPSIATSVKSAQLAYEQGQMTYEETKRKIELSVRKTFYQLLYFNENLELQQKSLDSAAETYKSNLSKYNQGRLSELNLLTSQYNYESKIPTIENLKTTYESNLDSFKEVLGIKLSDKIELNGNLEEALKEVLPSDDEVEKNPSLENVPAIKSALKNIEIAENSLAATKFSAWGPSLSLSANASTGSGINPSSDQTLSLSYSATVRIPLDGYLPWSSGSLSVQSQKESLEKLKQNLEQTKTSTMISVRSSINTIDQALTQLELYEKNVDLMQKTYDMTKTSYNVGSSDLLTLQNAEVNLYQAKYNVQNQRYTIISAILDLENTLGIDFGTLNNN